MREMKLGEFYISLEKSGSQSWFQSISTTSFGSKFLDG